jgi:anti-anti-sigma factor
MVARTNPDRFRFEQGNAIIPRRSAVLIATDIHLQTFTRRHSPENIRPRTFTRRIQGRPEVMATSSSNDFQIEYHGNVVVVVPAQNVESMRWDLIEHAANVVMTPLRTVDAPMVVFDLSRVKFFGSVFLSLLLRCHKLVKERGGELVLCGASDMARELLSITSLDTLWAIYSSREEALDALSI